MNWPLVIQGGMGAGVSSWRLAKAVSALGQLGVVSGVAMDILLARRLQDGDRDGSVRRALAHFPVPSVAQQILDRYFLPQGREEGKPYKTVPMHSLKPNRELAELTMAGAFVEVFLAREGHENPVGVNLLEKIQLPHLPTLFGAMLAGVSFVIVGAGIATRIPGVLDKFATLSSATYPITVTGNSAGEVAAFDPRDYIGNDVAPPRRPYFLPIVSSNVLAATMIKRGDGKVDGFIIEGPTAGGHNAPPRGKLQLDDRGQPVYGVKDAVDLDSIAEMGLPFWLAGGQGTAEKLYEARAKGATGVQVGTAFAFCEESGLEPGIKASVIAAVKSGTIDVFTDPLSSPTRFPFKNVVLEGTLSDAALYEDRKRVCDLGFLREIYRTSDGSIGYRCPAEPVDAFVAKEGAIEETVGRKCLCNALVANIGMPQLRRGARELPFLTAGDDLFHLGRFLGDESSYRAADVIASLLAGAEVKREIYA